MYKHKRSYSIRSSKPIDDNSFEISFSSEFPYLKLIDKKPMYEVLSHSPDCVDMSRAMDGLSLLWDHRSVDQIGRAENIAIDPVQCEGTATIRFGNTELAKAKYQDVLAGITKDVSFGYEVYTYKEIYQEGRKYPIALVTNWMPYEISLVSVGADPTVGVGRSLEDGSIEEVFSEPSKEPINTKKENQTSKTAIDTTVNNNTDTSSGEASSTEDKNLHTCTKSKSTIEEFKMDNKKNEATPVTTVAPVAPVTAVAPVEPSAKTQQTSYEAAPVAPVTMPKSQEKSFDVKDMRGYSIGKAVKGILNGRLTGFEAEIGQDMAARGFQETTIPTEALVPKNLRSTEFNFSTATSGQEMKITEFGSYLDLLLTGSALQKLGVPVLNLQAPITFPALDSVPTPTAKAETATGAAGAVVTRQVTFSPTILVSGFGVSRTALNYAPASLDSYLKTAIYKKHIQEFDKQAIVKLIAEITQTVAGNGTGTITDDIAGLMSLATKVMDVTDLNDTCSFLTSNGILNDLKLVQRSGSLAIPVATTNSILDWKAVSSANVGKVAGKDPVLFGDWSFAAFANFGGGVNIVTDIYGANAYSDSVSLVAQAHYDAHIMNTLAFAKMVTEVA